MTSLTEVYEGNAREVSSLRRLYAGTGLVLVGAALAIVAILIATTDLFSWYFANHFAAVRVAGVLAGVGVPVALVGVFIVLPASNRVKAAAAIGATLCLFGIVLFWHAYPYHWRGYGDNLTLHVSVVYLLGLFTALWCLFIAVVNFKTRNDPGGTLEMNVVRQGRTKIVEVDDGKGLGGIGLLGGTPDTDVETQTNKQRAEGTARTESTGSTENAGGSKRGPPTSDGGSTAQELTSPLDASTGPATAGTASKPNDDAASQSTAPADRYCGSCRHFRYVRTSSGMVPYCGQFDEAMEDMDACEEWAPNHQ